MSPPPTWGPVVGRRLRMEDTMIYYQWRIPDSSNRSSPIISWCINISVHVIMYPYRLIVNIADMRGLHMMCCHAKNIVVFYVSCVINIKYIWTLFADRSNVCLCPDKIPVIFRIIQSAHAAHKDMRWILTRQTLPRVAESNDMFILIHHRALYGGGGVYQDLRFQHALNICIVI